MSAPTPPTPPTLEELRADGPLAQWNRDPAASGWRSRAFVDWEAPIAFELHAYDDGRWSLYEYKRGIGETSQAHGREETGATARARVIRVWKAMRPMTPEPGREAS